MDNNEKGYKPELRSLEAYYQSLLERLINCDDDMKRIRLLSIMINYTTTIHMLKEEKRNG